MSFSAAGLREGREEGEGRTGGEGRGPKLSRARITTVTFWKRNKKGEV